MYSKSLESQLLLQLLLDARPQIKKNSYVELMNRIAMNQAKSPLATEQRKETKFETDSNLNDEQVSNWYAITLFQLR